METQSVGFVGLSENSTTGRSETATFVPRPVQAPAAVRWVMRHGSALAPDLAARLAQQLFFKPPRTSARADQRAIVERGASFSLHVDGCVVRGHTFAARPTVALVHGWGGNAGQMTAFVEPLLSRGYGVVIADMPGHGRSSGRLSSLLHFAHALRAIAGHVGGLHAVIAHSFGAAGTAMALSEGLSVTRAAFIASPARFDSFWSRFQMGVEVSPEAFARLIGISERWLGVSFAELHPEVVATQMTTPLFMVHDVNDREIDVAEAEQLSRRWPGAKLWTTSGLGHGRILQDPGVVERLADWVAAK